MTSTRNPEGIRRLIFKFQEAGGILQVNTTTAKGRPGAWTCALGLLICLMGCQTPVAKAPQLPPPRGDAKRLRVILQNGFIVRKASAEAFI